jgi:hypothetical protein
MEGLEMFGERKTEPRTAAPPTLGAWREKLIANGYEPVSLLVADDGSAPAWLTSEHPAALKTLGRNALAAIVVTAPEDPALHQRIQGVLERRGLTRGPMRVGSDRRELWPLRADPGELLRHSALDGAVELIGNYARGPGCGVAGVLIPLDGAWIKGDPCSVPYARLPALSAEDAMALFRDLEALKPPEPYVPPPTRRHEPTPAERDLAELRRNPDALAKRMHELTGNPAMQQATLQAVRGAGH